jgi:5-formyltetrahydrofolate cyclo-ligase
MGDVYDDDKRKIRRAMHERRAALGADEVARGSAAACARMLALPVFAAARHVVVYDAMRGELDPAAIAERARVLGKSVYYPRPPRETPGFAGLDPGAGDVIFVVPGLAFDARGVRIGRGGGWYDRALGAWRDGVRVGFGFDFQLVPVLPEAPWDVRMHLVVTDERLGTVKESS